MKTTLEILKSEGFDPLPVHNVWIGQNYDKIAVLYKDGNVKYYERYY